MSTDSKSYAWSSLPFSDLKLGDICGIPSKNLGPGTENYNRGYENNQYSLLRFFFQYLLVDDDNAFAQLLKDDLHNLPFITVGYEGRIVNELAALKRRLSREAVQPNGSAALPGSDGVGKVPPRKTAKGETVSNIWESMDINELTLGSVPGISEANLCADHDAAYAERGYYNDTYSLLRFLLQFMLVNDVDQFAAQLKRSDHRLPLVASSWITGSRGVCNMLGELKQRIRDRQVMMGISPLPEKQPRNISTPARKRNVTPGGLTMIADEDKGYDDEELDEIRKPMKFEDEARPANQPKGGQKGGQTTAVAEKKGSSSMLYVLFILAAVFLWFSMYIKEDN